MSDVEKYWEAIRSKCSPTVPPWNELDPQAQHAIILSINQLISVLQHYQSR